MMSDLSLVAAVILLTAVAALGGTRIVVGERHAGNGVAVAPRTRRLRSLDLALASASALLVVALGTYLVAGVR